MGRGMALNMLRYGQTHAHEFRVFDINCQAVSALEQGGAIATASIAELAQNSDIVFTSLPSSKEVNMVAMGAEGLLENLPSGAIWFETSTSNLSEWKIVRDAAPGYLTLIDAPVTGGTEGAAAGTLTMLLGLEAPLQEPHADLLGSITDKIVIMGPSGSGYIAKLCQLHLNYLVAQGIGEALMLGAKGHLDLMVLHDVLSHSCAQSYVVDNYIPKVLDGSYDPSFTLGLAKKDISLIEQLGTHLNVDMPLGNLVHESYAKAVETYGPKVPHLSIVRLIESESETKLRG